MLIATEMPQEIVLQYLTDDISLLFCIMAWHVLRAKPLYETIMTHTVDLYNESGKAY